MNTLTLGKIIDLGGALAGRTPGFPASEREQMRGPMALGLDRVWDALAWPGMAVLEEFTPTDGEVSRRVGTSVTYGETGGEIGRVWNAWDEDPREDEGDRVVWEESTSLLFFPDDTLETVWVEYSPPVPDLLAATMTQAAFEAASVPRFMAGFLALVGAAALHAMDGHYDEETKKLTLAESELQDKITKAHVPARRANMQVLTR